jgi:spore coat protein A
MLTRREFLRRGLLGGLVLTLPLGVASCGTVSGIGGGGANNSAQGSAGSLLRSAIRLPEPFAVPLPIPPILSPARQDATTDYYEITQRAAQVEILPGIKTEIWGYNGIFPGPTIVSRRGRLTSVRHRNELAVPTVVHLHGGKTPPEHDGYPTDLVLPVGGWDGGHGGTATPGAHGAPGGTASSGEREYRFPLDQPAATLWYHDHRMDFTGPQVYKGLAGFHLVRDAEDEALGLPAGERDIPLLIADRAFAADGSFHYPALDPALKDRVGVTPEFMSGVLGDCILVNGAPWPTLEVTNTRYRFRILNASNARRYRLALDPPPPGGKGLVQIGSDLGLLAAPVAHDRLDIAQAERFEVIIDFSRYRVGTTITLTNAFGSGGTSRVMRFVVAREGREGSQIPARLAEVRPLTRSDATVERSFQFARGGATMNGVTLWTINGKPFDPQRIDANPRLGAVELWKIRTLNVEHPIHIHLGAFQVLSKNGDPPGPYNAGWKDTVNLDNGGQADLLVRFDGFRGKYLFHCHNLEHEDMMMMGNLTVV